MFAQQQPLKPSVVGGSLVVKRREEEEKQEQINVFPSGGRRPGCLRWELAFRLAHASLIPLWQLEICSLQDGGYSLVGWKTRLQIQFTSKAVISNQQENINGASKKKLKSQQQEGGSNFKERSPAQSLGRCVMYYLQKI